MALSKASQACPSLFYLMTIVVMLAGCAESTRRVPTAFTETPTYAADMSGPSEGSLSQRTPKDLTTGGFAYLAAGNMTLARLHFVSALKRDPDNAQAYVGLGDISYQVGDFPSALANYRRAAALDESNLAAILGQAQSLRQQGKLDEAVQQLEKARALGPNDIRVLTEQAINYDLLGKEQLATPIYQEIAARSPEQAASFNNIGVNKLSQGEYAEAISNFSKAYILDGKNPKIVNNLAMAFALYGQPDQALKLFTKTVGEAAAWNNLGYLYMNQGKYNAAEAALYKAIELNPKFYERAQENLDRLEQLRLAEKSTENASQPASATPPVAASAATPAPPPAPAEPPLPTVIPAAAPDPAPRTAAP